MSNQTNDNWTSVDPVKCPICGQAIIAGPSSETVQTERGPAHRECTKKGGSNE